MKLLKVDKKSFLNYSNNFKNLPVSFNPDLDLFLKKKNFTLILYIIKINNECVGLLPAYKKNNINYSVPYFSYGLVLNIPIDHVIIEKIKDLLLKNLINFKVKLLGSANDLFNPHKVSAFLDLKFTKEDQLSSFNSKLRSQIKKGYKNGLKCEIGGKNLIYDFWIIYSKNLHSIGSPSYSMSFFHKLLDNYNENQIKIFIIKYNSVPIGSSLYLSYNGFSEVILASTLRKYNYLSTNMMMYWEMIVYSIENGNSIFSFGRSDLGSTQLRFKKQWGVRILPISYLNSKGSMLSLKELKNIFNKIWRIIPYSISKRIGYLIAEKFY